VVAAALGRRERREDAAEKWREDVWAWPTASTNRWSTDVAGRTAGRFFADEVAAPLDLDV
jgi:hypothetical protein